MWDKQQRISTWLKIDPTKPLKAALRYSVTL